MILKQIGLMTKHISFLKNSVIAINFLIKNKNKL